MKLLSRDFTTGEKVLILVLVVVLLALGYYKFVFEPSETAIMNAESEKSALNIELAAVNKRVETLEKMKSDLDSIEEMGGASIMGSYNNSRAELDLINDVFRGVESYTVTVSGVTRSGDQIRRNFALTFDTPDLGTAERIISALSASPFRCLVNDIRVVSARMGEGYSVSATATFFETMVGGTPDAGLPADSGK